MFGLTRLRPALQMLAPRANIKMIQSVRNAGNEAWTYRSVNTKHSPATMFKAEALMTFFWWWVLTHLWYQHDHITGHHVYPDPSQWTDAELGIPADEE